MCSRSGAGSTGSGYAAGGAGAGSGYTEANGGGTLPTPTPTAAPTAAPAAAGATTGKAAATTAKIPKADSLDSYLAEHILQSGETVSGVCAELGVDFDANDIRIQNLSNIANYS